MDKNIINILLKCATAFLIVLSFGILSWAYFNYRQAQNIINPERVISFSAEGRVIVKPDIAKISFSVTTQGAKADSVQAENNQRMQKLIDFVKSQEVLKEDIRTISYSLNPQYDYTWCRKNKEDFHSCPPKIVGYGLTQTAEVKIRDFEKINSLVGGLSEAGANQISNVSFEVDDPENYKNLARIEALKKIEARAKMISQKTSLKLGRVVNISEGGASYYREAMLKREMEEEMSVSAPIEPGTQEIVVALTVSYEIK